MRYFAPFSRKSGPLDSAALSQTIQHIATMQRAPVRQASEPAGSVVEDIIRSFWRFAGPVNIGNPAGSAGCFPTIGRVNAVAFDPANRDTWYAGAPTGGVWKTIDAGKTWRPIADSWPLLSVSSIAVDKSGKNVYVGTGDCPGQGTGAIGVMKSTTAGASWKNVSDPRFKHSRISKVAVHPDSPDIVLAADFDGLLWRSGDGGTKWKAVNRSQKNWVSIDFSAKNSHGKRTCYAMAIDGKFVYVSTNDGVKWTAKKSPVGSKISNGRPQIAASPVTAETVYVFSPDRGKVWHSTNFGGTWKDITAKYSDGPGGGGLGYSYCMACSFDSVTKRDVLYVGNYSVFMTEVGSGAWLKVEGDAPGHADMHALAVSPSMPNSPLIGNDGGVYFGIDMFLATLPTNETLTVAEVYQAGCFFTGPELVGMQDTGSAVPGGKVNEWTFIQPELGGDGGGCAVALSGHQFATSNFFFSEIQLCYSIDRWKTSKTIVTNKHPMASDPNRAVNPPMVVDPYDWSRLYVATNYLYRWTSKSPDAYGGSWKNRLGGQVLDGTQNTVQGIAIGSSDGKSGDRIYTGAFDGQVWMSVNAGGKWRKINGNLPAKISIGAVSVNPQNADDLVIVLLSNGSSGGLVWRCEKTTTTSPKWVDVSRAGSRNGLPATFPFRAIARDLFDPVQCWYVGGDFGLFYTQDAGAHWYNAGRPLGLPNVPVYQLQTLKPSGLLVATTFGRGVYTAQLAPAVKIASLRINPSSVKGGTKASGTIKMDGKAPPLGIHAYLKSSDAAAKVPAVVHVDSGETSVTFTIDTTSVKADVKCTITATYAGTSKSAEVSVAVN